MEPWVSALVAYSLQVLAVVAAATIAQAAGRIQDPALRLLWWRGVALLCLALPLLPAGPPAAISAAVVFTPSAAPQLPAPAAPAQPWPSLVVIIIAAGSAARLAWLAIGALRLRRLRRESVPVDLGSEIGSLHAALAPSAEFRASTHVRQPVTFGLRHPVILVPARLLDLPGDERSAVACHELLHVARRDWPWILVEEYARALFWFHPGVWWLVEQMQISREQLVDRLVVSRLPSRRAYMSALVAFAGDGACTPSTPFLRRRQLRARLRQLTQGDAAMSRIYLRCKAAALMVVTAVAAVMVARVVPLELPALAAQAGTQFEIRLAETSPGPGLSPAALAGADRPIYLHPIPVATGGDVASAGVTQSRDGFAVTIAFTDAAAARVAATTAAHVGRPLAIVVDGRVVSAPVLRSSVGQWAVITGVNEQEARALAEQLDPGPSTGRPAADAGAPIAAPSAPVQPQTVAEARAPAGRLNPSPSTGEPAADGGAPIAAASAPVQPQAVADARDPGIVLPRAIYMERPSYTPEAMLRRLQGVVVLSAVVRADGRVDDIVVVRSLDTNRYGLDDAAIRAAAASRFAPGTRDGVPVDVRVTLEFDFTL